MNDVDLVFRLDSIERRLSSLEHQKDGTASLFGAVAESIPKPQPVETPAAPRVLDRREMGSVGCQEQQNCSHTPCLCAMAWNRKS